MCALPLAARAHIKKSRDLFSPQSPKQCVGICGPSSSASQQTLRKPPGLSAFSEGPGRKKKKKVGNFLFNFRRPQSPNECVGICGPSNPSRKRMDFRKKKPAGLSACGEGPARKKKSFSSQNQRNIREQECSTFRMWSYLLISLKIFSVGVLRTNENSTRFCSCFRTPLAKNFFTKKE